MVWHVVFHGARWAGSVSPQHARGISRFMSLRIEQTLMFEAF